MAHLQSAVPSVVAPVAVHSHSAVPSLVAPVGQAERFGKKKSFSFEIETFHFVLFEAFWQMPYELGFQCVPLQTIYS